MERGRVLKAVGHGYLVLTPDGRFLEVKGKGRQVVPGEELFFGPKDILRPRAAARWKVLAVAAGLLLAVGGFGWAGSTPRGFAHMTVEGEGLSVTLALDGEGRVVGVEGLSLPEARSLYRLDYPKALEQLKEKSGQGPLVVTFWQDGQDPGLEPPVGSGGGDEVVLVVPPQKEWKEEEEKARGAGLNPGQVLLLEKAQEQGVELDAEEVKAKGVVKALLEKGVKPGDVFGDKEKGEKEKKDKKEEKQPKEEKRNKGADLHPGKDDKGKDKKKDGKEKEKAGDTDREDGEGTTEPVLPLPGDDS
ncbi:MAG: anti-sigma factor domain-containing protein [Bacillota bacterium]|nr:anti-sigma factor domain-containing protein [Bacillota bacterium]